jgi:transposase
MQVLYTHCAGIDVHKKTVVVTILLTDATGHVTKFTQTFGTMTAELLQLDAWLEEHQVSHIAIESTGVYWFPVYNLLEDDREVILVNPQHMKAVPARKTDVKDSEWLADLLRHGLLKASFIPPRPIRELRELTRYRKRLSQDRAQQCNRLQKILESANIKLAAVASDILGVSGRAMLAALIAGKQTPEEMAELAHGRMRNRKDGLRLALEGRVTEHHRFMMQQILDLVDCLERTIHRVEVRIADCLQPYEDAMTLLQSIPGINATVAAAIITEIGTDMSKFPSAAHLASWAGVCPGNKQSGGKRMQAGTNPGNRWLRGMLGEVVWTISRTHDNYLNAQFARLLRRRGKYKAVIAVAHSVMVIVYHVLSRKQPYTDLGSDYFERLDRDRMERQAVRKLEQLGCPQSIRSNDTPFHRTSPTWVWTSTITLSRLVLVSICAICRYAPRRFACERDVPRRFVTVRFALLKSAPFRNAPSRFTRKSIAPLTFAPLSITPCKFAETRFAPWRFALWSVAPLRFAKARFAPLRFAPFSAAPLRSASARSAPLRFTQVVSTSEASATVICKSPDHRRSCLIHSISPKVRICIPL